MSEDWLQKVRDRMSDYEADEPAGLWEAIESRQTHKKRQVVPLRIRWYAAAAMAAFAIIMGTHMLTDTGSMQEQLLSADIQPCSITPEAVTAPLAQKHPTPRLSHSTPATATVHDTHPLQPAEAELPDDTGQDTSDTPSPEASQPDNTDTEPTGTIPPKNSYGTSVTGHNRLIASVSPRTLHQGKATVSMFTSGGAGSISTHSASPRSAQTVSIGSDGTEWNDNPMLGIMTFNHGQEIRTEIKHRIPIRAGLSVSYNLTGRLAIETGLTYTNLTSDIKEGSERHYFTGEQKLHYVGIPLNLKYRLFTLRKFDLYASSGVLAEKCVSAKLKKTFILAQQTKGQELSDITEKPLQWSANATIGLQYNLTDAIGLYAEPGVSYYFDDGSTINTIYKDKPVNFNLNLGLRFTFGR